MKTRDIFKKAFEDMTKVEVIEVLADNYDEIVQTNPDIIIGLDEYYLKGIKEAYKSGYISLQEALLDIADNYTENTTTIEWLNEQIMKDLNKFYMKELLEKWLNH